MFVGATLIECRLLHRILGAVAGLAENMAGLRFSYAHKLVLAWPDGKKQLFSTNET